MRLFHGTLPGNEAAIDELGICPPTSCPKVKTKWRFCNRNAVYVTKSFGLAYAFGSYDRKHPLKRDGDSVVYEITKIPKTHGFLDVSNARQPDSSMEILGGCIRPQRKCRVHGPDIRKAIVFGSTVPKDWPDKYCKWVKV